MMSRREILSLLCAAIVVFLSRDVGTERSLETTESGVEEDDFLPEEHEWSELIDWVCIQTHVYRTRRALVKVFPAMSCSHSLLECGQTGPCISIHISLHALKIAVVELFFPAEVIEEKVESSFLFTLRYADSFIFAKIVVYKFSLVVEIDSIVRSCPK